MEVRDLERCALDERLFYLGTGLIGGGVAITVLGSDSRLFTPPPGPARVFAIGGPSRKDSNRSRPRATKS